MPTHQHQTSIILTLRHSFTFPFVPAASRGAAGRLQPAGLLAHCATAPSVPRQLGPSPTSAVGVAASRPRLAGSAQLAARSPGTRRSSATSATRRRPSAPLQAALPPTTLTSLSPEIRTPTTRHHRICVPAPANSS